MVNDIRTVNCSRCQNKHFCPSWKGTEIDHREKTSGTEARCRTLLDIGNLLAKYCTKYDFDSSHM